MVTEYANIYTTSEQEEYRGLTIDHSSPDPRLWKIVEEPDLGLFTGPEKAKARIDQLCVAEEAKAKARVAEEASKKESMSGKEEKGS
jgi:hypothetical protein